MLEVQVLDQKLSFLVDTGATYSTMNIQIAEPHLSADTVEVVGFSGVPQKLPKTVPLYTKLGKQTVMHPYVISQQAPVNLLGRDLLMRLGASILCCADGLTVALPDGTNWTCMAGDTTNGQWLLCPVEPEYADIYWGLLEPETPAGGGILSAYLRWKPWVSLLAPYTAPPDPPHVTLFYDRQGDDCYQDWFQENLEGNKWQISSENIYVGPEGVASTVKLTDAQLQGYKMGQEAVPHVSLALHPEHQAKDLGPMVKKVIETNDWVPSQIPCVSFSPSCRTWCIQLRARDIVALQHEQISRDHGREKTDQNF
ncbi:uncharacterized protein LOC106526396 [Austrofundulus limnaeus]|uniref:Uncharacterized protein LOC106526396 n=1 Tax=Austrofundulus limnaeus TaxID=52670 RepID=A0A2I4C8X3_AUSLI|nr:PREDICTED: uncharacterized protein LOC106526396 [Austrofundulus limnaeus]